MIHLEPFDYLADRFADIQVLRFRVPNFEVLSLETKKLLFFLSEAALCGRDITWDQHYRHNLTIRRTLEAIVKHYEGDRELGDWLSFMCYTKRVWFSNGIHHHYSNQKFVPDFLPDTLRSLAKQSPNASFPLADDQSLDAFLDWLEPIIFNPEFHAKRVSKDANSDLVLGSCVNFYEGVTQVEVQSFYAEMAVPNNPREPSHGLNSKLVKQDGKIVEQTWKLGGMYSQPILAMIGWLEKAVPVAQTPQQATALKLLIDFYRSGDLATFDAYNVAWLKDLGSSVDTINGFIETYGDPLDFRGTFEAVVSIKDPIATQRIETIANNAQWFEQNSPIEDVHKKDEVKGVSGAVINVVMSSGDMSPASAIGVNLPNADWIRAEHGSKSVNLANIVDAYSKARGNVIEEFAASADDLARNKAHGDLADNLHTDLHEVVGHGSGQILAGVATPKETLQNYSSTLEEARADLVALYYLLDPKLIDLGLMPSLEVGKTAYDDYMRNGLMLQLRRLNPGDQLEEDHMRNRQLIASWVLEQGSADRVLELIQKSGKSFVIIHNYDALRSLFGRLLREVQRIKSEGDFQAGKALVEGYGVRVNPELHAEVLERFSKLNVAPYFGFLNPVLTASRDEHDEITDVSLRYAEDFTSQMLFYAQKYSLLSCVN